MSTDNMTAEDLGLTREDMAALVDVFALLARWRDEDDAKAM